MFVAGNDICEALVIMMDGGSHEKRKVPNIGI